VPKKKLTPIFYKDLQQKTVEVGSVSTLHQFSRDAQVKEAIAYLKDEKKYKKAMTQSAAKAKKK
jgi:hypothetical protein